VGFVDPNDDAGFAGDSIDLLRHREGVDLGDGRATSMPLECVDLLRHIGSFVGDERAPRSQQRPGEVEEGGQVGDAAREDSMVPCTVFWCDGESLGPGTDGMDICQSEVSGDTFEEVGFLALGVEKDDPHLRSDDPEREAGEAGATAQVKEDRAWREVQEGKSREGIEKVVRRDAVLIRARDQVDPGVPEEEVIAVRREQGDPPVVQLEAEVFRALDQNIEIEYILI